MHICIFSTRGITGRITHWGGVHTHLKNLIDLLIEDGHAVSVITGSGDPFEDRHLKIIPVSRDLEARPNKRWFRKAYNAYCDIQSIHSIDCAFSQSAAIEGFIDKLNNDGIPVVVFNHLLNYHYFYNIWQEVDGWYSFKSYMIRTLPRIVHDMVKMDVLFFRKCNKLVFGSSTIARQVEKYYRINQRKIDILHNWVDTDLFFYNESARTTYRQSLGIRENEIAIILLGTLWRPKGFRVALHAFKEVHTHLPKALLIVSGHGPDQIYIENYLSRHQDLKEKVKLIGQSAHGELPGILSACDIFIIPSLMNEVLPYTLLEAMACQIPIIASDIAANREAIGPSGSFFPKGDTNILKQRILEFSENLSAQKADAIQHRVRVEKLFSKKRASEKLRYLLNQAVDSYNPH